MIGLIKRNLKMFFRDRLTVFFSLLSVFIIIGLYVLFLGDAMQQGLESMGDGVRFLMDSWIMAGLLAIVSITTTMGAFGGMVEDKSKGKYKDFAASPISRGQLVGGYIFSAIIIGLIMSVITLVLSQIYIVLSGGQLLPVLALLKVLGLMALSVVMCTAMVYFMVSFLKSTNAFATASTILGTMIGFLTGIYIPIGQLPEAVQWVIKIFPVSHSGKLFRDVMMEVPMNQVFAGAPAGAVEEFKDNLGLTFKMGSTEIAPWMSLAYLVLVAIVFYLLCVWRAGRKHLA